MAVVAINIWWSAWGRSAKLYSKNFLRFVLTIQQTHEPHLIFFIFLISEEFKVFIIHLDWLIRLLSPFFNFCVKFHILLNPRNVSIYLSDFLPFFLEYATVITSFRHIFIKSSVSESHLWRNCISSPISILNLLIKNNYQGHGQETTYV